MARIQRRTKRAAGSLLAAFAAAGTAAVLISQRATLCMSTPLPPKGPRGLSTTRRLAPATWAVDSPRVFERELLTPPSCSCGVCRRLYLTEAFLAAGLTAGALTAADKARQPVQEAYEKTFVRQMQGMADYERRVAGQKAAVFSDALKTSAPKTAVEIGVGTGVNFKHVGKLGVQEVIAVEPNTQFLPVASAAAQKAGVTMQFREGVAEAMPFESNSVDLVVGTLVLCSVDSVQKAVAEVKRVLRPGGKYVFVEHVADPGFSPLRVVQSVMDPLQKAFSARCSLTREPLKDIQQTFGETNVQAKRWSLMDGAEGLPPHFLLAPHILGFATKET
eukprot:TRINITY_DN111095_c0_g1_i1.p1 TRINITY_DN111095_c0_g1~~TRINITY_DN111095_c0_g1_i1.p1  ORF type:complete len:333 (+),score=76.61 TRINITY_DN111095_c0_g1_i1:78-1076(+)